MTALLPVVLIIAVALVVLYLVRESGETAARSTGGEAPGEIDFHRTTELEKKYLPASVLGSNGPAREHVLKCPKCSEELDLDLFGGDPERRGAGVMRFWADHDTTCFQQFPADNKPQKQGAPGS